MFKSIKSFRFWSLLLGAMSMLPIAYFMYQNWLFSQWAKEQARNGGFICGTGMLALLSLCIVVTSLASGAACLLGTIGYLRTQKPRSKTRLLEIAVMGTITAAAVALVVGLLSI